MVMDDVFRDYALMGFICNPYFSSSQEKLKSYREVSSETAVTLQQVCLCKCISGDPECSWRGLVSALAM